MSNDLVKRLREYAQVAHMAAAWGFAGEGYTMEKAADRIEELEAKLAKAVEGLENVSRLVDNQYADRLYTQTVAGWEQCADDVKDVARTTLAKLTGGKDEC